MSAQEIQERDDLLRAAAAELARTHGLLINLQALFWTLVELTQDDSNVPGLASLGARVCGDDGARCEVLSRRIADAIGVPWPVRVEEAEQ